MMLFKVKHIFIRKYLPVISDSQLPTSRRHETHLNVEIESDMYEHVHRYLTGGCVYHAGVRNTLSVSFFLM